jgi:hypothetical protein
MAAGASASAAASAAASWAMRRVTGRVPVTLFRVQTTAKVRLRVGEAPAVAPPGSPKPTMTPRDDPEVLATGGVVSPRPPSHFASPGLHFPPNGMRMLPKSAPFAVLVCFTRSRGLRLFEVPEGTPVPPSLALVQDHELGWCAEPAGPQPMTVAALQRELDAFLRTPGVVLHANKDAFYAAHPDMTQMAVGFSENA